MVFAFNDPQVVRTPLPRTLLLHVYADHLELHFARLKKARALWFRHIHALVAVREAGSEALEIIDRGGQVLIVPMTSEQVREALWLVADLME